MKDRDIFVRSKCPFLAVKVKVSYDFLFLFLSFFKAGVH